MSSHLDLKVRVADAVDDVLVVGLALVQLPEDCGEQLRVGLGRLPGHLGRAVVLEGGARRVRIHACYHQGHPCTAAAR